MKDKLILFLFLMLGNLANAQGFVGANNIDEVKEVCKKITTEFEENDIDGAFVILRNIWFISEAEINKLEAQTNKQLSFVSGRYGETLGTKLVKSRLVEDVAIELTFVIKYELHLLRFKYIFYKGKKDMWYLNSFKWDDSIGSIFSD